MSTSLMENHTVRLTLEEWESLAEEAKAQTAETKEFVSASTIVRRAVRLYFSMTQEKRARAMKEGA